MDSPPARLTVLHYVGYDQDAGGVLSAVRALATTKRFDCLLGVNRPFRLLRSPELPLEICPAIEGERLGLKTFWRARAVAVHLKTWLQSDRQRRLHLHSRAGLAAAWWLPEEALARTAISVHCLGRQRWFYRASARRFKGRIFWLHPAMRAYYFSTTAESGTADWSECIPSAMPSRAAPPARSACVSGNDRLVLGGIGSLTPWKRWDLILDAIAAQEPALREKILFRHIGSVDGTARSHRYEAELRAHPGSRHVKWEGARPSSDEFLNEIDCLVVPSDHEPLSLAMLEALRAGVPVLRADSGGGLDAIWPGQNGWLFRSGDAQDLAAHLWRLIQTDALAGTRYIPEAFSRYLAETVAEQWLQVYSR